MPGGYQHRGAHGGTQRGKRSTEAQSRRYSLWQARRRAQRQDYRRWKAQQKDSALRVHGSFSPPPIHLKPTTQQRLQSRLKSSQSLTTIAPINQTRDAGSKISLPLPTGTPLHLMTWNVEGLRETAKYDLILKLCIKHKVSLLCAQETKATSSYSFCKSGWEILLSGHPKEVHHGVGFFVSPTLRSHTRDFKPHSSRICELTLDTLPHPITVFNIYAPSTTEDAEEDRRRKTSFWEDLAELLINHPNSSHILLMGDCNARLDPNIDPTQQHVGSHVVGKRQTILDIERDNALHLIDLLEGHGLELPQTFQDLPLQRRVSYKEMSCQDHLLETANITDWTTLDYAILPPSLRQSVTFRGNIFQQLVNSRHLPLLFSLQTHFQPAPPKQMHQRKDYTDLVPFYNSIETALLDKTDNAFTFSSPPSRTIVAYTDGSCPNNRTVSFDNPAGWGFTLFSGQSLPPHPAVNADWLQSWGKVRSEPTIFLPELPGSNNTGELKALIELFDYLLYFSDFQKGDMVIIYTDSQYAQSLLLGSSTPVAHHQLVILAQQYFTALRTVYRVHLLKVPSHEGIPGNELADRLAKKGVHSSGKLGRFSTTPSTSLRPPDIGFK